MPDTDVAEKVGAESTPETPTDLLVAQPGAADAPPADAEVTEPTAAEKKASAPQKTAREEQLERELRVSRGDQAKMRQELTALQKRLSEGDPVARSRSLTAEVRAARAEATALNQDPDAAEQAVRDAHKKADADAASETSGNEYKAFTETTSREMGEALTEAGLTTADWHGNKNKDLRAIKVQWGVAVNVLRDADLAHELAEEVKAMKKPAPVVKTAAQRARELSLADTGPGGAGAEGAASYRRRLKEGKPLPPSEDIDRMTASFARG